MDKNKIIEQYWLNDEVNQAFAKMQPEELQYDLKVEVFMVLLDMEDSKLFGLIERNEIRFYIVRTMLNMIRYLIEANFGKSTGTIQNIMEKKLLK